MRNKAHDPDFTALKLLKFPKDKIIVDIGTNRGEAILSMLLMTKNLDCDIIGFEPNKLVFDKAKSAFSNEKRVKINNVGLGSEKSEFPLYIPYYRNWMFDGLSSFKREEAADWLEGRMWNYKENLLTVKHQICKVETLDDQKLNPYFIKIDVQGFELEVLKGGIKTIEEFSPIILIESINDEIEAFLRPLGYNFYAYHEGKFSLGRGHLNTFCIPKDKMTALQL
ncbi:MAG: FkbM family methyltransferase [Pelobium sp.]